MSGKRVLLIEDSPTQAILLQATLEEEGLEVDWAKSGEEAMPLLVKQRPDLIIADYHLPGIQGDELCRQIRMNLATQDVPIVMLTADQRAATQLQGLESGADDYLSKSDDMAMLMMRVQAHLARARSQVSFDFLVNSNLRQANVLAVDDSPTYALFLASELSQEGFHVDVAHSAEEGLALTESKSFDCILIDVVMPGMNGIQMCQQLHQRRQEQEDDTVLIVVSGAETRENVVNAMHAGADEFLTKANDAVLLRARVRGLLRRKFLREQNRTIIEEFKNKELETVEARARQEAAEARAALVEQLEEANAELGRANEELRETQTQLVHSAKMASLGELVAGIAHEVNNPLAYSLSHLQTVGRLLGDVSGEAAERLSEKSTAKLDKSRRRIEDAVGGLDRVRELVLKLRTFSRLDEGEFKSCDMAENIESTLVLLRYRLPPDVRLETSYAADNRLYCAPGALNQVVMNLATNAIDAVGEQGVITVATERCETCYKIVVSDSGSGIAPDVKDRIFDPFFTTKEVGSGTGLGLAIAYKIIARHSGTIEARDRAGGGAEFEVRIPVNLEESGNAT